MARFIESLKPQRNVLVPGCGQDRLPIAAFYRAGHKVTAIDFSPIAIEPTRSALPEMGDDIILGDFFTFQFETAPFDFIYERTFLCSLPPSLWKQYAARVSRLLRPGGMLIGFFFYGEEPEPPPYPLTKEKAQEVFGNRFDLKISEPVTDSLSVFGGSEKWQQWQLRQR